VAPSRKAKGEHAIDLRHGVVHPVAADQLEQNFGVRAIAQRYTGAAQFVGERPIAVDLAIEDERIAARLVDARLGTAREIDDREPGMAECNAAVDKGPAAVRTAMLERTVHRPQHPAGLGTRGGEPGYAAHPSTSGSARFATPE
jgi:hypothetical protein